MESYDDYNKRWNQDDFFEGPLEDSRGAVAESLVESMSDIDLARVAGEKNVVLPLTVYDYSELRMVAGPLVGRTTQAGWGSGQAGWIYATAGEVCAEYGDMSAGSVEKARRLLLSEVQEYDHYLSGDCYGYRLYEDGRETDSCWGFLGRLEDVLDQIACEALPESHRDMVDAMREVSDTKTVYKGYEDLVEEMGGMAR